MVIEQLQAAHVAVEAAFRAMNCDRVRALSPQSDPGPLIASVAQARPHATATPLPRLPYYGALPRVRAHPRQRAYCDSVVAGLTRLADMLVIEEATVSAWRLQARTRTPSI